MAYGDTTITYRGMGTTRQDDEPATQTIAIQPDGQAFTTEDNDDGGVTLSAPAIISRNRDSGRFDDNLAEHADFSGLANEVCDGVDADLKSREKFMGTLAGGIDLLGIEIEASSSEAEKSGRGGVSKVGHPMLTEAVVTAQSKARAELLASDGPVKCRARGQTTGDLDMIAKALQDDMNYYLRDGAPEYYPDMDRGLFNFFYSGNLFKKIYQHPLRRRPVSECIAVENLVVSQDATDLDTALRVTHIGKYTRPLVKRMQTFGGWAKTDLGSPWGLENALKRRQDSAIGVQNQSQRPEDAEYTVYETLVDVDLDEYGVGTKGAPDGLPLPIRITVERDTHAVLDVRRAWRKGDEMFARKQSYVHYGMVPAFNFLCLGYVHLLGNQAKALRAAWRLLIDAGLFSNFPGGYKATGVRVGNNPLAPSPGEWADMDIGAVDDIRKALLVPPYKGPDPAFIQLCELIGQDAQRLAGTIEFESGEGRTNIPVGTMLAMVEQATQNAAVIHKRMHSAQAREFVLLKECFAENPQALWKVNPDPKRQWQTAQEFENLDIVPASDPNVPAQVHRVMLALALVTMAQQNPLIYDAYKANLRAWNMIGVGDAEAFLHPMPAQGAPPPDPKAQAAMAMVDVKKAELAEKQQDNQRKAANEALELQQRSRQSQQGGQQQMAELGMRQRTEDTKQQTERMRIAAEAEQARQKVGVAMVGHQVAASGQAQQAQQAHADRQMTAYQSHMDRAERAVQGWQGGMGGGEGEQ